METIQRFIEIPLEELQTESGRNPKSLCGKNPCIICGKEIKGEPRYYVHLLTNGNIVSYGQSDVDNSQGFHPVGPECAKKLIVQFAFFFRGE